MSKDELANNKGKSNYKYKRKSITKDVVIISLLVASLISNAWFVYLNIKTNNFIIEFVTDVFYSYPSNVDPNVPVGE